MVIGNIGIVLELLASKTMEERVRAFILQSLETLSKAPTREAGDALYRSLVERAKKGDANDRLYQVEASMDYDPSKDL